MNDSPGDFQETPVQELLARQFLCLADLVRDTIQDAKSELDPANEEGRALLDRLASKIHDTVFVEAVEILHLQD